MNINTPVAVHKHQYATLIKDASGKVLCVMGNALLEREADKLAQRIADCFNGRERSVVDETLDALEELK
jgi:hypothetical protein